MTTFRPPIPIQDRLTRRLSPSDLRHGGFEERSSDGALLIAAERAADIAAEEPPPIPADITANVANALADTPLNRMKAEGRQLGYGEMMEFASALHRRMEGISQPTPDDFARHLWGTILDLKMETDNGKEYRGGSGEPDR